MAKKESTGDLPKAVQDYMDKLKVSAEEYAQKVEDAKSFDIDPHLVKLMWDEPFYSAISRRISKSRSLDLPTAGVCVIDGSPSLLWNPVFFNEMTDKEVRGVLIHEFMHLIYDHVTLRKRDPHMLWNLATDCAINSMIPESNLPVDCVFPGKMNPKSDPNDPIWKAIASFPRGQSSDWYMSRLMEDEDVQQKMQDIENGEGDASEYGFDDHEGWGDMSDAEKELVKGKIREILRDAVKEADSKNGWGSVPSDCREQLRQMVSNEVDWKAILRQTVGMAHSSDRTTSRKRRNRKYRFMHPGVKRKRTARVLVAIDQSGSVGNEALELLFGELAGLAKRVDFDVVHFDTSVDENSLTTWRRGQRIAPHRTRMGGTDFNAPTEFVNKHKSQYDLMVVLTDGEAPEPKPCLVRRAWVLVPGTSMYFDTAETVIKMKAEKEKQNAA